VASPGEGPATLTAARAEAARLQREVDRLDVRVETLAEAHAAAQARLDGLIQAAHRHQADLERSELALQATRAAYAGDVRELCARGPPAPLELLPAAGDIHQLAVAAEAAGGVLDRDLRALSEVGLATGTVRARVNELGATQAETLALRQRLADQEAVIAGCWRPARPCWPRPRPRCGPRSRPSRPARRRPGGRPHRPRSGRQALPLGATGPATFDCSGLTRFAYAHAGLTLPRTSRQQWSAGTFR